MNPGEAMSVRVTRLEEWRAIEQPAVAETRERVRRLELAQARLAGAAFVGSVLGGSLVSVIANRIVGG